MLTVYGIETSTKASSFSILLSLQQHLPFTVLKHIYFVEIITRCCTLQQHLPFTVCAEGCEIAEERSDDEVRTSQVPERSEGKTKKIKQQCLPFAVLKHTSILIFKVTISSWLQQNLPFTLCAAECEVAEAQSDDETHTLQVPERSEGKTKVIK